MQRKIEIKLTIVIPDRIKLPLDEIADDLTTGLVQWDETLYNSIYVEDVNEEEIP